MRLNKDIQAYNEGPPKQEAPKNPCDLWSEAGVAVPTPSSSSSSSSRSSSRSSSSNSSNRNRSRNTNNHISLLLLPHLGRRRRGTAASRLILYYA